MKGDIGPVRSEAAPRVGASSAWLYAAVSLQFLAQLALLTPLGGVRVIVRTLAFATSLVCLVLVRRGGGVRYPPQTWLMLGGGIVALQLLNPDTAGVVGGVAHFFLFISILAPAFWVSRLDIDEVAFKRVVRLFWWFYTASAVVGVLQAYYPGQFQPYSYHVETNTKAAQLMITLASGESILRPMGLTDAPGGAAMGGFYACVLGIGLLLDRAKWWSRVVVVGGMLSGVLVIYLSHVRSLLIMTLVCAIGALVALALRGRVGKLVLYGGLLAGVFAIAWSMAVDVGGEGVQQRVGTLVAGSAQDVYYSNRGRFLEHTLEVLLPEYPLGAGLARWGMMAAYFGEFSRSVQPLWAEIQWTGWLFDGGAPLMIVCGAALLSSLWISVKVSMGRLGGKSPDFWVWGGVMVGYNLGAFALTFNVPLFMGTPGLEFWMLNSALFVAAIRSSLTGVTEA